MRRNFNNREKTALYLLSSGKCSICGNDLYSGWHADHMHPFSKGGETNIVNGQALCPNCNLKKGAKEDIMVSLRKWQKECFNDWSIKLNVQDDYLITSTPGAGKTIMALYIAKTCFEKNLIDRVVIVVPTDNLKSQWSDDAFKYFKIQLDPKNIIETAEFNGLVLTYHSVNNNPELHESMCNSKRTLLIADEAHHMGDDKSWGVNMISAFRRAKKRLLLSGTPFRSDNATIPFVKYEKLDDGTLRGTSDYSYDYGHGVKDGILKKLCFYHIDGDTNFTKNGNDYEDVKLSDEEKNPTILSSKKKAAYYIDHKNHVDKWVMETLIDANNKLEWIRNDESGRPDAAGIIFVESIERAKCYETNEEIKKILGEVPVIVYSEKDNSRDLISGFKYSKSCQNKWIVSVNQISEGIDIKRLCVGVYLSVDSTELIFRQRAARIIRVDDNYKSNDIAFYYIPATPDLKQISSKIEEERDHVIFEDDEDDELDDNIDSSGNTMLFDDFVSYDTKNVNMICVTINGRTYEAPSEIIDELKTSEPMFEIWPKEYLFLTANRIWMERQKNKIEQNKTSISCEPLYKLKQDQRQRLDKRVKKLAWILRAKDKNQDDIDLYIKEINKDLWRIFKKPRKDLSIDELNAQRTRIEELIKQNGHS